MPSATSPGRTAAPSVSEPVASDVRSSAGSARLPTITGCMNSTVTCAASVAAAPAPHAISVPPCASERAIAWHARARRSRSEAKNASTARSRSAISPATRALVDRAAAELVQLLLIYLAEPLEERQRLPRLVLVYLRHREADVDQDPVVHLHGVRPVVEQRHVHGAAHAGHL